MNEFESMYNSYCVSRCLSSLALTAHSPPLIYTFDLTSLSYTGIGLGASDVAFMMATSVSPSVLQHHEDDLLRFYYRRLREWLGVHKNCSVMDGSFTWGRFMGQYKMAQLVYVHIDEGAKL